MSNTINFKTKDAEYELFFAQDDDTVEVYDKDNPRNGFIFTNKKSMIMFLNKVVDVLEQLDMEKVL